MYKLPEDLDNKYKFVTLAAKRAEQLQMGALARVAVNSRKSTVVAQEEVATGAVGLHNPNAEEAVVDVGIEEE